MNKNNKEKISNPKSTGNMNIFIYGRQNGKFAGSKKKRRITRKNK